LVQETVWLGDIPVATLRPGTPVVMYYVHTDHLNTPRKVSRPSDNALRWRWDSDLFGTSAPNQNPAGLGTFTYNLRFPGQYFDAESNVNYNYFRDFDPQVGRYVESDPAGLDASSNTYDYVGANPIMGIDVLGLFTYNAPPPQTVPVPRQLEAKVSCLEKCTGNALVITGGKERDNPNGGLYHSPKSLHYSGHAVDFGFNSNPTVTDHITSFLCCAVKCGLAYGGPEQLGSPKAHFHLQDVPGNGYDKPWPSCSCSNR
jgi:RHS repeat-associated protein